MHTTDWIQLPHQTLSACRGEETKEKALQALCAYLAQRVDHYDWVGFYLADPARRVLHLGPYVGAPTGHTEIPFGRGICGQVAESEETFVVPDVTAEGNYLACSLDVKAEIVVPILLEGQFLAQLDIDSHTPNPFCPEERKALEAICTAIAPWFLQLEKP